MQKKTIEAKKPCEKKTLCKKNLVQVASVRLQTLMHPSQLAETPKGQRSWTEVTFDDLKYIMEE